MSEIKKTHQVNTGRIAGLSVAWLAGMGALVFATLPSSSATHTSVATDGSPLLVPASSAEEANQRYITAQASTLSEEAPGSNSAQLAPEETVDFIVRFANDIEELDACSKMFRTDKQAAQKIFTDWAAAYESLDRVELKNVSYSGEMLLIWNTGINRPLSKTEVEDKLAKINALSTVRYADPDYTVKAQGGR